MLVNRSLKLNSNTVQLCRMSLHRLLPGSSITQNDGIDNLTTKHTAFRGKLRLADIIEYIQATSASLSLRRNAVCSVVKLSIPSFCAIEEPGTSR